ncbi:MAG: riboflavin synthase [Chloroflexota bacterium]
MFTGIVEEVGRVSSVQPGRIVVTAENIPGKMSLGDSIAVNGVCLTVTSLTAGSFSVDVMPETLRRTNLGNLMSGGRVNLERALSLNGRLGGHLVQGHIDGTAMVAGIVREGGARIMRFTPVPGLMRYIVEKGFIAVNGISLTVVARDAGSFRVSIVAYTGEHTTLGTLEPGDLVNLEIDIIAKYVEQLVRPERSGVTLDFLKGSGFL